VWSLAEVRAKGSLRPVSAQKPDTSLAALASFLLWLRYFFSHLTGLRDGTPGLCEAAVGSSCLPLPSSSPQHTHPKQTALGLDSTPPRRQGESPTSGEGQGNSISGERWWQEAIGCLMVQDPQVDSWAPQPPYPPGEEAAPWSVPEILVARYPKLLTVSIGIKKLPGLGPSSVHECSG